MVKMSHDTWAVHHTSIGMLFSSDDLCVQASVILGEEKMAYKI